ncbi:MAG: hypothetical protein QOH32_2948 [Bradyrhizobium sp.]|jgi:hypothetical protein|nr:hypothetical protein [Bradyrhizobium sp.]
MAHRVHHQDIVKRLLDSNTVDFKAIGNVVAELGPSMALADEPWEAFCGTMRTFIRLYIINPFPGLDQQIEKQIAGR